MHININVNHYHHADKKTRQKLDTILQILQDIQRKEVILVATTKEVLDDLTAEKDLITALKVGQDAIVAEDAALKQQVADLIAKAGMSAEDQANIDAAFTQAEANKAAILAATLAGTPAAPAA